MSKQAYNRFYRLLTDAFRHLRPEEVEYQITAYELIHDGTGWSVNTPFSIGKQLSIYDACHTLVGRFEVFKANYSRRSTLKGILDEVYDHPQISGGISRHYVELMSAELIPFARVTATLKGPFKFYDGAVSQEKECKAAKQYQVQRFSPVFIDWQNHGDPFTDRAEAETFAIALLDHDAEWPTDSAERRTQIVF